MKFKINSFSFSLLLIISVLVACAEKDDSKVMWLNSTLIKCGDPANNKKCYEVSFEDELDSAKWQTYHNLIDSLVFEVGTFHKVRIKETKDENGRIAKVQLIEIIEKQRDKVFDLYGVWVASELKGAPDMDTTDLPRIQIDIPGKRVMGSNSCNNFISKIQRLDKKRIKLGMMATSKKYCDDPVTPLTFSNALDSTRKYKIVDDVLTFFNKEGEELIKFSKSE